MTIIRNAFLSSEQGVSRLSFGRNATILLVLIISGVVYLAGDHIGQIGAYGYPAIFVMSLVGSAAFLMPAPGIVLVIAAGSSLDPLVVGFVAGLGAALGELTGYIAGLSGQGMLENNRIYWQFERWMQKSGTMAVFILAAVPNPLFDLGGIIAGASRMPAWRFVLGTWMGKSLRYALLATLGAAILS
jgi:membrane protein YqaA with SNARE-associated domain